MWRNWRTQQFEGLSLIGVGSNPTIPTRVKAIYVLVDTDADRCTDIASAFAASVGIRYVVETQWRSGQRFGE